MTSGDFVPCKNIVLDSDWITPELRRHIDESMFPGWGAIENGTGVRDKAAFQLACYVMFKKGHSFPLPNSSSS
jgi:hypothetical protein